MADEPDRQEELRVFEMAELIITALTVIAATIVLWLFWGAF